MRTNHASTFTAFLALLTIGMIVSAADAQRQPPGVGTKTKPGAGHAGRNEQTRVVLQIVRGREKWGDIVIELDRQHAPKTVENFLRYVEEGFYDKTIFHRVISDFMIQGGGYLSVTRTKTTGLHEPIKNEANNGLKNDRGTIAMARTLEPNSATSQFFINVVDNHKLDYPSVDGWGYCVFGRVVAGMDVVDRICNMRTRTHPRMRSERSMPILPATIRSARILKPGEEVENEKVDDGKKPPAKPAEKHPPQVKPPVQRPQPEPPVVEPVEEPEDYPEDYPEDEPEDYPEDDPEDLPPDEPVEDSTLTTSASSQSF